MAPAFTGLLDPGSRNPAALFEAVQQRVERIHVKVEMPAGPRLGWNPRRARETATERRGAVRYRLITSSESPVL